MANTPVYETTITVKIQYPGSSPEEAVALHKEFVAAIRTAAEALPIPARPGSGGVDEVRAEVAASDGPALIVDQEVPER